MTSVARPEDILLAYSPGWTSIENQAYPLEAVGGYEQIGGADIHDEDFTSSLRDFVTARTAAEATTNADRTLVGGWFGGAGADPSAVILGVDWLTPPSDDDSDEDIRAGGLQSYYITKSETIGKKQFRLDPLYKIPVKFMHIAILGDYAYTHEKGDIIKIYRRGSFEKVEATTKLLSKKPVEYIRACRALNCIYVVQKIGSGNSITRIDDNFKPTKWQTADGMQIISPYFSNKGHIIFENDRIIYIYDAHGNLLDKIALASDIVADIFKPVGILQKSNGHIVLTYINDDDYRGTLVEINADGDEIRKCKSIGTEECCIDFADERGNFMVVDLFKEIELLDSDFNSLGCHSLQWEDTNPLLCEMHFEADAKEIVCISRERKTQTTMLTAYRFVETTETKNSA